MTKEETKEYMKKYYELNKTKIFEHRNNIKPKISEYKKNYNEKNKDRIKEYRESYKTRRNEHLKKQRELKRLTTPKKEPIKKSLIKKSLIKTPEQLKEQRKLYYEKNKHKYKNRYKNRYKCDKVKTNQRIKERRATEPIYRLKTNIRSLISITIKNKGLKKSLKSEKILGCTFDEFKLHIENQFEPWMNWNNYGNPKDKKFEPNKTWDIDHIVPASSATTENEIIELNHYTNLKPLCSYVNRWVKRNTNHHNTQSVQSTNL
jgi:hypothetical protein